MCHIVALGNLVCLPDGREASCLCGHNVDSVSEIYGKILNAGACEFKHLILYKSVCKGSADKRDSNVVRTDAASGLTLEVNENHLGSLYVVCIGKQLLYKLRTTLTDSHSSKGTVTCMRIGAEYHLATSRKLLTSVGVNYTLVCGNIYSAIFLSGRKTENVIVLIDSSANRAKRVVAVGHSIWNRELLKSACTCSLNDTNVCDIVGNESIKFDLELLVATRCIVRIQN